MKQTVLTFGVISGAVSSLMMLATVPFIDRIGFDKGAIVGYTAIVASFLPVFFGVRAYREQSGGTLTFGRGLAVGILIALISSICYVATWQVVYFKLMPDFVDRFSAYAIAEARAAGASEAALVERREQMARMKAIYDNPALNAAITFVEPFPIGVVVSLISAGVLRRRTVERGPQT